MHDRLTHLVWPRRVNFAGFPLTWNEALAFVRDMNRERRPGYGDWRLPNINELESLVDASHAGPALPPAAARCHQRRAAATLRGTPSPSR